MDASSVMISDLKADCCSSKVEVWLAAVEFSNMLEESHENEDFFNQRNGHEEMQEEEHEETGRRDSYYIVVSYSFLMRELGGTLALR
ncbi:hypothetical protein HID58_073603 [Brassica napus]|uniref:Uncharacterized protein n=1 Tax=Brassica napus TaxID=3708 RepID=A0ABQ7Z7N3_BRANA|nr:hypothetical protein HID58_073603 [Brassica napus]